MSLLRNRPVNGGGESQPLLQQQPPPPPAAATGVGAAPLAGLGVLLIVAVALAVTFGALWGSTRSASGSGNFARAHNGCLYSTDKVLLLQQKTQVWYGHAYGLGGFDNAVFYSWDRFDPEIFAVLHNYTTEEDAIANHTAFREALELKELALSTQSDPNVGELEAIGINFILREVDLWLNNTRINWYHNSFGSYLFGVTWDIHILEAWSVASLLAPEFSAEPDFGPKMNRWLEGYIATIPTWTEYFQAQVDAVNPHVHANVTIAEWSATWTYFATPGDFAANVCGLMTGADQTTCEANAAIADTLNAEFLALWDGDYGTLAAELRPDANPGLSSCHEGALSYDYWIKYHTELQLTPEEINAEGLSNVAATQTNINAAMQRLDPPQTLQDYITRANTCGDPDFYHRGGLDTCVENQLGDHVCAKEYLEAIWSRFGDILTHVPEVDGYLGRNSYAHQTDSTGGTYTFSGNYDAERSLYTSPSVINWGWGCVGLDGYKYYDHPMKATTTLIHEGVPGHQSQLPLQQELTCQVSNLTASTAWFEGWGLWSETLGFIMNSSEAQPFGLYQNPYAEAGRWDANLLRTARLVVDTRLHALGNMSYLDCADYYAEIGLSYSYGLYECSRYITMPGQALAYWIGKNQFQAIVDTVQTGLGDDFDYREFLMLVSKFGGLGVFTDLANLADTFVLWKLKDPAAITSFGYNFFVNDFYKQAAPIVAKGGKDLASVTAVPPASKRRHVTHKHALTATLERAPGTGVMKRTPAKTVGSAVPPRKSLFATGYKMQHAHVHNAKRSTGALPTKIGAASARARSALAASIRRQHQRSTRRTNSFRKGHKSAHHVKKANKRTPTLTQLMNQMRPPARLARFK